MTTETANMISTLTTQVDLINVRLAEGSIKQEERDAAVEAILGVIRDILARQSA